MLCWPATGPHDVGSCEDDGNPSIDNPTNVCRRPGSYVQYTETDAAAVVVLRLDSVNARIENVVLAVQPGAAAVGATRAHRTR